MQLDTVMDEHSIIESRVRSERGGRLAEGREEILLSEGLWREAYDRYALEANRQSHVPGTDKQYPQIGPKVILGDLVDRNPER
jgi:hypothetical protein